jgi:Holliday junction resolvase-like predicted endonuclease
VRGEPYAYWYLCRHEYFQWRAILPTPESRARLAGVGYDGSVLAFVEGKTRTILESANSSPDFPRIREDAVNWEKRCNLSRMARQFLRARHIESAECRFDVLSQAKRGRAQNLACACTKVRSTRNGIDSAS